MSIKARKTAMSFALKLSDIEVIESMEGKNDSIKLSNLIAQFRKVGSVIVRYDEDENCTLLDSTGFLIYESKSDGSVEWGDRFPIIVDKKKPHNEIIEQFREAKYRVQIEKNSDTGFTAIWAAPEKAPPVDNTRCVKCRNRVLKAVTGAIKC